MKGKQGFQKGNQLGKRFFNAKHSSWKGGVSIVASRNTFYRYVWVKPRTYEWEHRQVMENFLGRKLRSNEIVHHRDGNGLNNDINNLQLMSWGEHTTSHKLGKRKYPNFICKCGSSQYFSKNKCERCYHNEYMRNWNKLKKSREKCYA